MAARIANQQFMVENGRIVRLMQIVDDETGQADQQVQDLGEAPPGANEGETASTPEQLAAQAADSADIPSAAGQYSFGGGLGGLPGISSPSPYLYGSSSQGGSQGGYSMDPNNVLNGQAQRPAQTPDPNAARPGTPGYNAAQFMGLPQGSQADENIFRNMALYNPDNPSGAMTNAMIDAGMNPFNTGNPFVQMLQRAAPGAALAFTIQNALAPGMNAESITNNPDAFKNFLMGGLGGGHLLSGLASTASQIPAVVQAIRAMGQSGQTGVGNVNPFLNAAASLLGDSFGEGTTNALAALLGPSMNRTLLGGYRTGLDRALALSQRKFGLEGDLKNGDIWQFLLGQ